MNGTRVALLAVVAACALAVWWRHNRAADNHWLSREFIVETTLARLDTPIIVLGDSIVEASTLPRSVCGHPIVNAGIGGASTKSGLGSMISEALNGKQAAVILVSLGSNDAVIPSSVKTYESDYRALLEDLAPLTSRRAILAIPLPEAGFEQSKKLSSSTVKAYNEVLPSLAEETHAIFVPLPAMPDRHTIDGIHLNTEGYKVWDRAVISGLEAAVCNEGESAMSPIKSSKPPNSALRSN